MRIRGKHEFDLAPIINSIDNLVGVHKTQGAPSSSDDVTIGYYPGYLWVDESTNFLYVCSNSSTGSSVWDILNSNISLVGNGLTFSNSIIELGGIIDRDTDLNDPTNTFNLNINTKNQIQTSSSYQFKSNGDPNTFFGFDGFNFEKRFNVDNYYTYAQGFASWYLDNGATTSSTNYYFGDSSMNINNIGSNGAGIYISDQGFQIQVNSDNGQYKPDGFSINDFSATFTSQLSNNGFYLNSPVWNHWVDNSQFKWNNSNNTDFTTNDSQLSYSNIINGLTFSLQNSSFKLTNPSFDLYLQNDAHIFTDNSTNTKSGLQYADDYSLDYTLRSLVDKEYVDLADSIISDAIYLNLDTFVPTTKSALSTLITNNNLELYKIYAIADSTAGGIIYIRPITKNSLEPSAVWAKQTNLKSFGHIQINGTTGSVDTLTVNGVNIMTAPVSYTTSITQTAINVCTNINANSGVSGYRAIDITNGSIVIEANTASTSTNGYVVSGSATSLTFSNSLPLANGQTPTTLLLDINYNLSEDRITRCQDGLGNIVSVYDTTNPNVNQAYLNFPWGDSKYKGNIINSIYFFDNFLYSTNGYCVNNQLNTNATRMNKNFLHSTSTWVGLHYNILNGNGTIRNNCINVTSTSTQHMIGYNQLLNISSIANNYFNGSITTNAASIDTNKLDNGNITNNIFNLTSVGIIQNNTLSSNSDIDGNTSTSSIYIFGNELTNDSTINSNRFNSLLSLGNGIKRNKLFGFQSSINSNIITATTTSNIMYNNIIGRSSSINSNTLAGANANIQNNVINGNSSGINSNTTISNSTIQNNVINASNSIITGITLSTDYLSFQNLTWNSDEYSFIFTTNTFNNTANRGLVNSPVTLGYIMPKVIPSNAFVDYGTMTSATSTAQIKIGIETDNDSNILSSTVITSLNGTMQEYSPIFIKPTVLRKIILTPTVEGLTGGQLRISLKNKIGL
jgi:hypothetical protein